MKFELTDSMALLREIDSDTFVDDFNNVKDQIPDNLTIQFEPSQPDMVVNALGTGRQMYVNVVRSYVTNYVDNTMYVTPVEQYFQQLLPLSA